MTRKIAILGATGSVGKSTLDLVERDRDRFEVTAVTAATNVEALAEIARRTGARLAVIADEARLAELSQLLAGVPAPAGAGLAFVPIYLWLITGDERFHAWQAVMPWTLFIAALMISSLPTYSWASIRIRRSWRLFALAGIALLGAALITSPWPTLLGLALLYLAMIPFAVVSYSRLRRRRATAR